MYPVVHSLLIAFPFTAQETIAADDVLQDSTPPMPSTNNKEALDKER